MPSAPRSAFGGAGRRVSSGRACTRCGISCAPCRAGPACRPASSSPSTWRSAPHSERRVSPSAPVRTPPSRAPRRGWGPCPARGPGPRGGGCRSTRTAARWDVMMGCSGEAAETAARRPAFHPTRIVDRRRPSPTVESGGVGHPSETCPAHSGPRCIASRQIRPIRCGGLARSGDAGPPRSGFSDARLARSGSRPRLTPPESLDRPVAARPPRRGRSSADGCSAMGVRSQVAMRCRASRDGSSGRGLAASAARTSRRNASVSSSDIAARQSLRNAGRRLGARVCAWLSAGLAAGHAERVQPTMEAARVAHGPARSVRRSTTRA